MAERKEKQALFHIEYQVVKPFVHATALALAVGGPAAFSGNFWGGFVCGSTFSLGWYWGSENFFRPKAQGQPHKQKQTKLVNGKPWTFDQVALDQVAPGQFVTRQNIFKDFLDFLGVGNRKPMQRNATPQTPKPKWMTEQVFHSHYNGFPLQLLERDVIRFLRLAQKYQKKRGKGAGLSERTWSRNAHLRPLWYQELPCPAWYRAMMNLIYAAQQYGDKQLIVEIGPRQIALAREANQVLEALRWLEDQRSKN